MRAGSLRHRAEILSMGADLAPASHGSRWVGIRAKESADAPAAEGLRTRSMVEVRARSDAALIPGRYLRQGGRLLHITSVRDPMGNGAELVLSCEEFVGECGEAMPLGLPARRCRVFLQHDAPLRDDMGQVTAYKTRAEVALIEAGRLQAGYDQLRVCGVTYNVLDYEASSDDGIVRGLWLEPVG